MAGSWSPLRNPPTFAAETMLLLTDGRVMVHQSGSNAWWALTPDPFSANPYVDGTWSSLAPLPDNPIIPAAGGGPTNAPTYFASAVLKDGRVFVAGGEDNNGKIGAEILAAQIYDPDIDIWQIIPPPPGWAAIGDAPSCVLPDGRVLLGEYSTTSVAIYDPAAGTWARAGAGGFKGDLCSEETWTLLPGGNVLTVQCSNTPGAEMYVSGSDRWQAVSPTPAPLPQPCPANVPEIGPAILLPDGRVFAIGATGYTALYNPTTGTFSNGPVFRDTGGNTLYPMDAPACLLPNGRVLCTASPAPPCKYPPPTSFFEYDPATNALAAVPPPPSASIPVFWTRMLLLPTGQVLLSANSSDVQVYTPDGAPNPAWAPTIAQFPSTIVPGCIYVLGGTQFNGLSQAVSYGDDAQMATNYPLVRIRNSATGQTLYCKTFDHSTMDVATGRSPVATLFRVPINPAIDIGPALLTVVANGIASPSVSVTVDAPFLPVYKQGDPGTGIGDYDLSSLHDRIFAFDYNHSGKLDHLVLYRPGTGIIWVVEHGVGSSFGHVYPDPAKGDPDRGIGGYDLVSLDDKAFAFDYDHSGKPDHLILYRPGTGIIWIVEHAVDKFGLVYPEPYKGDPPFGIGDYDLANAADQAFAFDYSSTGNLDHLVIYRAGFGIISVVKHDGDKFVRVYPDPSKGDPERGIGGYDLSNALDQVFAFDYTSSGKLDHLVLYRPGTGTIWILAQTGGKFVPVFQQGDPGTGIGGYDLRSPDDQVFAYDFDGSGKLDHLVLFRPGTGAIWILRQRSGRFEPVYQQGDPGTGIGGYDLARSWDRAIAYDYDGSGKLDHLLLYRPGTGTVWILRRTPCSGSAT